MSASASALQLAAVVICARLRVYALTKKLEMWRVQIVEDRGTRRSQPSR